MRSLGLFCLTLAATWPATASAGIEALTLTALRGAQPADATQPTSSRAPGSTDVVQPSEPPQPTSSKAPASTMQPTSSKAPASTPAPADPTDPLEEETPVPESDDDDEDEEEITLETSRRLAARDEAFHRHGIGAHAGIVIIPTWLLSNWLASHTNALCRGNSIGGFASDRGLNNQDGCNFYVGADYTYRFSRVVDVTASVQYQRAKVPEGLWLDKARYNGSAGLLEAADYTEVDLGLIAMEVDFIARAPIVITKDVEFSLGGGAGLGLGILFGGVFQTPLGAEPSGFTAQGGRTDTCQTLEDLADLTRCTPRYDINQDGDDTPPDQSELSNPNPDLFASCDRDTCNEGDLDAFGYRREQGGLPPVIPVLNLIVSARVLIKDTVGITINGGFNTGFYFGGGVQYYFGKAEQDEMGKGATMGSKRRKRRRGGV